MHSTDYMMPSPALNIKDDLRAIQMYNKTIAHMKPIMAATCKTNIRTVLTCRIIFISIENLHGRYLEAVRHFRAGCQLLGSYRQEMLNASSVAYTTRAEWDVFEVFAEMLQRLGQSLIFYSGGIVFHDLRLLYQPQNTGDSQTPFGSFSEARNAMNYVEYVYNDLFILSNLFLAPSKTGNIYSQGVAVSHTAAVYATRMALQDWSTRFKLFKSLCRDVQLSRGGEWQVGSLSLHEARWSAFVKNVDVEDRFTPDDCEITLDRVESLLGLDTDKMKPVFSIDGGLVSSIAIVCAWAGEDQILDRAISMLRSMDRTEGVWSGSQMADICLIAATAMNNEQMARESFPRGIPRLAAELSRLGLTIPSP